MFPSVTQSFKLQVVGLKLCSGCLSLSIVLLYKNMQPFERDRQEPCVIQKKRGELRVHCSKCWLKGNWGPKRSLTKTSIFSPCLLRASARSKI